MNLRSMAVNLFLRRFKVPRDLVRFAFRRYGPRTALITPRGELTYAQLEDRVLRLATGWTALGVGKGDHVFTQLRDDWEQIEVRLAAYELGAVLTSFHEIYAAEKVLDLARLVQPRIFVFDPQVGAVAAERFAQELPDVSLLAAGERYEYLIAANAPRRCSNRISPSDPAILGFTSGTTGQPKGLFATQGVAITSLRLTAINVHVTLDEETVYLQCIPLAGAGSGTVLPMLFSGAVTIIPPVYEAGETLRLLQVHRVTRTFMTPSLLIDILDRPDLDEYNLSALRNVIYGTAPMPAAKLEEAIRRFGPIFQQGYGMAEILPPVSLLQMEDHVRDGEPAPRSVLTSVGRVVPEVGVKIVDEQDRPVPTGEIGQVLINSPTTFTGYWRRPDLTEQALKDGWMHTDDLGYFDDAGWLHVLDRRADVIQRAGRVIYPRLVEEAIHDHPAIKEACLVNLGPEEMVMCVSLRRAWRGRADPHALEEGLGQFLAGRMESWQVPDRFQIFEELARSFLIKVLRPDVREALSCQSAPAVE